MLCNMGEILARAYVRSRASFEDARDKGPNENVSLQRRLMNAASKRPMCTLGPAKCVCDVAGIKSAELRERDPR